MRISLRLLAVLTLFGALNAASAANRNKQAPSPKILSAKTIYFRDETGSEAVRNGALDELRKWGRFQIVSDREHADLVFVLSSDPYRGGLILLGGGQTASVDVEGHVEEDAIPNYNTRSPSRLAYLDSKYIATSCEVRFSECGQSGMHCPTVLQPIDSKVSRAYGWRNN